MAKPEFQVIDGFLHFAFESGESGKLPLMGRLPRKRFKEVMRGLDEAEDKDEYLAEVFRDYIGDTVDTMTMIEFTRLSTRWNDESEEDVGASLGE